MLDAEKLRNFCRKPESEAVFPFPNKRKRRRRRRRKDLGMNVLVLTIKLPLALVLLMCVVWVHSDIITIVILFVFHSFHSRGLFFDKMYGNLLKVKMNFGLRACTECCCCLCSSCY